MIRRHVFELGRPVAVALALVVASAAPAGGQQDTSCTWDRCALRLQQGFFGPRLVRGQDGDDIAGVGWFAPALELFEQRSDSAAIQYRAFRSSQNTSWTLVLIGLGAMASSIAFAAGGQKDVGVGVALGGFAISLGGVQLRRSAENALSRAVWWYNRSLPAAEPARGRP